MVIQLHDIISALINELNRTVSTSNGISARLSDEYNSHSILKHFTVPNIDFKDVTIELTLAMTSFDSDRKNGVVIVDEVSLKNLATTPLSTVIIKAKMHALEHENYP